MIIKKIGFYQEMLDNDIAYLNYILSNLERIDKDLDVRIINKIDTHQLTILPSKEYYKKNLILKVKELHRKIKLDVQFSKTLKLSDYITWEISLTK